eukprot:5228082-Prymnesium_polylepis.1
MDHRRPGRHPHCDRVLHKSASFPRPKLGLPRDGYVVGAWSPKFGTRKKGGLWLSPFVVRASYTRAMFACLVAR